MSMDSDGKARSLLRRAGTWACGVAFRPGWGRRIFLAAAAILFLIILSLFGGGVDYRRDPSAVVPRSVHTYWETRDLNQLLTDVGSWRLWLMKDEGGQWNQAQLTLASMITERVGGLGTFLPLRLLSGSKMAAFCISADEKTGADSWALYLDYPDAAAVLGEIRVEPGLKLETATESREKDVYALSGAGGGKLYIGVVAPWLVISSDAKLPEFALQSVKTPGFSLARAGILLDWSRNVAVRGMVNPLHIAATAATGGGALFSIMSGWMSPETRIVFTARLVKDGQVDAHFVGSLLSDKATGGGMWPLVKLLLGIVGLLCLVLAIALVLIMLGWGGWLKAAAIRAGIAPVKVPAPVTPSAAFKEDAGIEVAPAVASEVLEADSGTHTVISEQTNQAVESPPSVADESKLDKP